VEDDIRAQIRIISNNAPKVETKGKVMDVCGKNKSENNTMNIVSAKRLNMKIFLEV
jgi:hypothetical protein